MTYQVITIRGVTVDPIANVVFPTAIDRRDDLGLPGRFDVYYGMADNCIGVARLDLPEHLMNGGRVKGTGQITGDLL